MIPPADARSRGEAPGKPCSGSQAMAFLSSGRRENSTSCANGQALLQLDSRPSHHACGKPLPTGQRPLGARAIINAELIMANAEMQKCRNAEMENGEWRMENGECRMENGECRMENAEWRMENAEWRMENAEWRMHN